MASANITDQLSRQWGHTADMALTSTGSLGLSGGIWTLPLQTSLQVPPLSHMRLVVNLAPLCSHRFWADGRQRRSAPSVFGALRIAPSNEVGRAEVTGERFRFAQVYIPHHALETSGLPAVRECESTAFRDPCFGESDTLTLALTQALLDSGNDVGERLYRDHLSVALISHLYHRFGYTGAPMAAVGALGPFQARRATEMLRAAIGTGISLNQLASGIGMSPFHFARSFRRTFGVPPHAYLRRLRIEAAMEMLSRGSIDVTTIALDCGYATPSAFTAAFRRHTGTTPSAWRRQSR